jgi:hypothetical protein
MVLYCSSENQAIASILERSEGGISNPKVKRRMISCVKQVVIQSLPDEFRAIKGKSLGRIAAVSD